MSNHRNLLSFDLPRKEEENFQREGYDPRKDYLNFNHMKIMYQPLLTKSQATKKWESIPVKSSQKIHAVRTGLTITFILNKLLLEGNLSRRSCKEKTITLEGAQLLQIRGRDENPIE